MKESIGYSVTINIVIIFVMVAFVFVVGIYSYAKAYKASSLIIKSLEKYEGYSKIAKNEISMKLHSLGYGSRSINCSEEIVGASALVANATSTCTYVDPDDATASKNSGYCVYKCVDSGIDNYYYYKIRINMMINIPVIGDMLDIPIYSNTDRIFDFENAFNG